MNPFRYPTKQHRRRERPPATNNYHDFKPFLRREFERKCIYCRLPDTLRGESNFAVEHFKPKDLFPELLTVYSNLFYVCSSCNRRKWNIWPAAKEIKQGRFFPNPCANVMDKHIRYKNALVIPRSHAGVFLEEVMMLNTDENGIAFRKHIIRQLERLVTLQKQLQLALRTMRLQRRKLGDPLKIAELDRMRAETVAELDQARLDGQFLAGEADLPPESRADAHAAGV
ncbi:MAG: HNH endonuclease [Deltaproteobacteria bacterium]|nr:HNH endonuclease [Deltaproteobacteria bacterium]